MSMSATPKISVLVPTYNNERYLRQCLDSARSQTFGDFEVICLNDGSTDGSRAIMEEYASRDPRFKIIDKENSGYGDSMNHGLDMATGEFVAILESDDRILPRMFERLYRVATQNDLDFVKADFHRFYGEGDSYRDEYVHVCPRSDLYETILDPSRDFEVFDADMCTWTGVYRRSFLEAYGIRYNTTPGAAYQDNGFWFQTFIFAHRMMFIPESFYQYRQDNPNSSINSSGKVFCMCEEHTYMHGILDAHPELPTRFRSILAKKMFHNYNFTYDRIADTFKPAFLERFGSDFRKAFAADEVLKSDFWPEEWQRLNNIVDDPILSSKKFQGCYSSRSDKIVSDYRYRRQLETIIRQEEELEVFRGSRFYRVPRTLKKVSDYVKKFGAKQLFRRAVFKEHVSEPEVDRMKRPEPSSRAGVYYPVELTPYTSYVDSYDDLDTSEAVLSWYRRRTGRLLDLDSDTELDALIQRDRLQSSTGGSPSILALGELVARCGADIPFLLDGAVVLDDFDELENRLFEDSPRSFIVRTNANISWEVRVPDIENLELDRLRRSYDLLGQCNLSFMAGETVNGGDALKLVLEPLDPSYPVLGDVYEVVCVDGSAFAAMAADNPYGTGGYVRIGRSLPMESTAGLIEAAERLSAGMRYSSVRFERLAGRYLVRSVRIGEDAGVSLLEGDLRESAREILGGK